MSEQNITKIVLAFTFRMSASLDAENKFVLASDLVEAHAIAEKAGIDLHSCVLENAAPLSRWMYQVLIMSQNSKYEFMLSIEDKDLLAVVVNPEFINDGFAVAGGGKNEPGANPFHADLTCMGTPLNQNGTYMLMSSGLDSDGYKAHPMNRLYLVNSETGNRIELFLGKDF